MRPLSDFEDEPIEMQRFMLAQYYYAELMMELENIKKHQESRRLGRQIAEHMRRFFA
jgi:hypothetical protein